MKKSSHDTHHYSLDSNTANEMLQNILQSCEIKPNDIPLNQLLLKQKISHVSLIFMRILAALLFFATLLAPLAIPRPKSKLAFDHRIIPTLNVIDYKASDDQLIFYLNTAIHVDSESSYLQISDGTKYSISQQTISSATNSVSFTYDVSESEIYIYDENGKLLKIHFIPIE